MQSLIKFHGGWSYALVAISALTGIVSLVIAAKKREIPDLLEDGYFVTFAAVYVQIVVGAYMWSKGLRPADTTHVLYGFVPAIGILVLLSTAKSLESRRAVVLGIACLLIAGMGVRGIMTGPYY
ncbi:MAG: hypothetical protein DCC49_10900 [Acidobacteria bacterium]|nr:MAG: hypothetical protein DCC49_10900 [Acidobacteriota bacterium]